LIQYSLCFDFDETLIKKATSKQFASGKNQLFEFTQKPETKSRTEGVEMNEAANKSFLKKLSGKRNILIFAGILAVAVVHSVVQLSFIQSETLRSAELTAQIDGVKFEESAVETKQPETQIVDIKPEEYKVRKVKVATIPEYVQPIARRQAETIAPQTKKKVVRETKTARLRRAEKILTGV
jgi:hypothetical protein